jgi:uncharacterized protein (DUF1697 family)
METLVALIRGINLGSAKRVRMPDLRAALEDAGYEDVQTYLQSGNVVLRSDRPPDDVARDVSEATGVGAAVLMRTAGQIAAVVEGNPFPQVDDGKKLHVAFLDSEPSLPEGDFAPEAFVLRGGELYIWLPDGMQRSKLMKVLSRRGSGLGTATLRNWNTVTALHEMSA